MDGILCGILTRRTSYATRKTQPNRLPLGSEDGQIDEEDLARLM